MMDNQAEQQREATIAAALALPEAERYRLWRLLDEQFGELYEMELHELEVRAEQGDQMAKLQLEFGTEWNNP